MERQTERRLRYMALSLAGMGAVLLVGLCLCCGRPVTASAPASTTWSDSQVEQEGMSSLTDTDSITVFLPLVARSFRSDCRSYILDDFSNPETGWYSGTLSYDTFYYDLERDVYRITTNRARPLIGSSPEWMVPDDAVIRVDAWIDNAPSSPGFFPAVGVVFGLGFYPYQGEMYWLDWYEFRVYPLTQRYALIKLITRHHRNSV